MEKSKKNKAPLKSNSKQFGKIMAHPGRDPSGLYALMPHGCDPCLYNPKLINAIFQRNKSKDPWKYKIELEDWAKNLGFRNQTVLEQRRWFNSILGPAWHFIPAEVKYEAACKNLGFGRTSRFKTISNSFPGPGSYYKKKHFINPDGSHSQRPIFEREELYRFKDTSPKWSLAPNRYNVLDTECIELKSKKIVSVRGPYDLFTGKRDESTIKNHFSSSLKCTASTWPLGAKTTLDKYKKSHCGCMNKTYRNVPYRGRNTLVDLSMCIRRSNEPGPGHYDVIKARKFKQNKYGFNSSYDKPTGYKRDVPWPGVGRYSIKEINCGICGQGHRHVFLSKQQRTIGGNLPTSMNSF